MFRLVILTHDAMKTDFVEQWNYNTPFPASSMRSTRKWGIRRHRDGIAPRQETVRFPEPARRLSARRGAAGKFAIPTRNSTIVNGNHRIRAQAADFWLIVKYIRTNWGERFAAGGKERMVER